MNKLMLLFVEEPLNLCSVVLPFIINEFMLFFRNYYILNTVILNITKCFHNVHPYNMYTIVVNQDVNYWGFSDTEVKSS